MVLDERDTLSVLPVILLKAIGVPTVVIEELLLTNICAHFKFKVLRGKYDIFQSFSTKFSVNIDLVTRVGYADDVLTFPVITLGNPVITL